MQKNNIAVMQTFPSAFSLIAIIGAMHVKSGMDTGHKHTYTVCKSTITNILMM
jgi:hypothetical protein